MIWFLIDDFEKGHTKDWIFATGLWLISLVLPNRAWFGFLSMILQMGTLNIGFWQLGCGYYYWIIKSWLDLIFGFFSEFLTYSAVFRIRLRKREGHYLITLKRFRRMWVQTANMREVLIDWLVKVAEEYKLLSDTLYLTVSDIGRFLSVNVIPRQRLQLLDVSSMLIAA